MTNRATAHSKDMQAPTAAHWTVRMSDRETVLLIMRDENGAAIGWGELDSEEAWQLARHLSDSADDAGP